ncbi:response regulator [Labilibacter sediminis]|nr:response regulator [Labilibacter sediminis]
MLNLPSLHNLLKAFILFCLCLITLSASAQDFQINYLSVKDGLSQNDVTSIIQDKFGLMWFGTKGGLNRYDGYKFKHFKPGTIDKSSLHSPAVERLYCDSAGNILIGTKSGGIGIYEMESETFSQRSFSQETPNRVISFLEDSHGKLWFGGWSGGLIQYDKKKDSIKTYSAIDRVNSVVETIDGSIWCGSNEGLFYVKNINGSEKSGIVPGIEEITEIVIDSNGPYLWLVGWEIDLVRYNYHDGTYKTFPLPWDKQSLHPYAYSLLQDSKTGNLLVGTWGDGLYLFDVRKEEYKAIDIKPFNTSETTIDFDVILDLYQGYGGDIWVGTDGGGIVRLSDKSQFHLYKSSLQSINKEHHVNTVLVDSENKVWIGTKGRGLYLSESRKEAEKIDFNSSDDLFRKEGLVVKYVYEDTDKNIWVSYNEGIYVADKRGNKHTLIKASSYFNSPDLDQVNKAHQVLIEKDNLWVATQQEGLFLFVIEDGLFKLHKRFNASPQKGSLADNRVTTLLLDASNEILVGTYKGFYKFDDKDSVFIPINDLIEGSNMFLCDIILCAYKDSKHNLWLGTPCSLTCLIPKSNGKYCLKEYTIEDGLSDDYINGILSDNKEDIWVSTNGGISRLTLKDGVFRNYDISDGVGSSNFSEGACCKGPDGMLYFGGYSDLTYFDPNEITENQAIPPLVITDFKILNKKVEIDKKHTLKKNINIQKNIILSHNQKEFSFEFAALDYKAPHRNQYAYWLEGSTEDTVRIGNRRFVSFSNLAPGKYTLHFYGSNSNGIWNEQGISLGVKIRPAPWRTWYAILGYILFMLLLVGIISRIGKQQVTLINEAEMEKALRKQETKMNEYKLKFFTNVSHEIRTPLTLILAPINELLKKNIADLQPMFIVNKLKLVQQNTNRLYNLVNQLLEFRKVELGKVDVKVAKQDIVCLLQELCEAFDELAVIRNITFKKLLPSKEINLYFDKERIGVVVSNLLSNAFKNAGKPGEVSISIKDSGDVVNINVMNNGKGIPKNEIQFLFDRFYQASGESSIKSSGIGLSLVKGYTELHKGKVLVESEVGKLTTFTIVLPKGNKHFSADQIVSKHETSENLTINQYPVPSAKRILKKGVKGASVLVVEDNHEVRSYITSLLLENFEVIEAEDGMEGYDLAVKHKPKVVISDVMMPYMDGYELCSKLKSNELVSHIPVVLLTAKGAPHDKVFGTRQGADVYLTKPFDPELLIENITQLIENRTRLIEKYSDTVKLEPKDADIDSEEAKFLKKAIAVIEQNIGVMDFDPDHLAVELGMSHSTLYRKSKKVTNLTPGAFIKSIRFKRAAQLLRDSDLTVSEIIESIGYQDMKNFRRSFVQEFDLTPTDYRRTHRN